MTSQDFEHYAQTKAMRGHFGQTWIDAFEQEIHPHLGPSAKVLDYGFGDGRFYKFYLQYFASDNIHGVEPSRIRTQTAQNLGWKNAIYLPLRKMLPYADACFDFVNMVEVIEHVPCEEIAFYLAEIRRVLRPGGRFLLTTPNYPIKRFYDVLDAFSLRQPGRLWDDPTHVSQYNPQRLRVVLEPHFSTITLRPYKYGRLYRFSHHPFFWHKMLAVCA
jgi:SAM-dependent methyltransferase